MVGVYTYKLTAHDKRVKSGLLLAASSDDVWIKASTKCSKRMLLKHGRVSGSTRCLVDV